MIQMIPINGTENAQALYPVYPAHMDVGSRQRWATAMVSDVSPGLQHVIDEYREANRVLLTMWEQGGAAVYDTEKWWQKSTEAAALGMCIPQDIRIAIIHGFAPQYQDTTFLPEVVQKVQD